MACYKDPRLPEAGGRNGAALKGAEVGGQRAPQLGLNDGDGPRGLKGRHAVLQQRQLLPQQCGTGQSAFMHAGQRQRARAACGVPHNRHDACRCVVDLLRSGSLLKRKPGYKLVLMHAQVWWHRQTAMLRRGATSVNSAGSRSERVEKSCPSFMKVGPSARRLSRVQAASVRCAVLFLFYAPSQSSINISMGRFACTSLSS